MCLYLWKPGLGESKGWFTFYLSASEETGFGERTAMAFGVSGTQDQSPGQMVKLGIREQNHPPLKGHRSTNKDMDR